MSEGEGEPVATKARRFRCPPEDVFRVLEDGWLYPSWVVGATRMRDVDVEWPTPGFGLQHSVGVWPLLINDSSTSELWEPPRRMVLKARGWPIGEARVTIEVLPADGGCLVFMQERAVSGPATLLPTRITDAILQWRNRETLRRLAYLAEGLHRETTRSVDAPEG